MRRMVLLLVCCFFAGASIGTGVAKQSQSAPYPLSQPPDWVAFTADVTQLNTQGDRSVGKFRRSSNGSMRTDIRMNYDKRVVPTVEIQNYKTKNILSEYWWRYLADRAFGIPG